MSLIQQRNSQLAFLASFSIIPIFAFTRSRWNTRFGLDQFHVILIQLLFTLFIYQKLNFSSVKNSSKTSNSSNNNQQQQEDDDKNLNQTLKKEKLEKKNSLDTTVGIAKSLKELIENKNDWIHVFPNHGIEILQHRSIDSLHAVRTEIEEHGLSLEKLVRCIRESKQWEWDKMCECGEDLGDGITWLRLKGFWPIKPKELIIRSGIFQLSPSQITTNNDHVLNSPIRILAASRSTTHPLKQSNLEIKFAGYLIEQIHSSNRFQVTQIVDLSGFGPLPNFVTKAILNKFIPSSLNKLIVLAHKIQPLPKSEDQEGVRPSWMPPLLNDSITKLSSSSTGTKQESDDQESLRPIVYELKKIILDLQVELKQRNQSNIYPYHSKRFDLLVLSAKLCKLISLLGASSFIFYLFYFLFVKYRSHLFSLLKNRFIRRKKLNFINDYGRIKLPFINYNDEFILSIDLFSSSSSSKLK